jgi:heme-degrading monooxygenase HmoA
MDFPAATSTPPCYAVIYSSQRTAADSAGPAVMADPMVELAAQQPGFPGLESVRSTDDEGITLSYWQSLEAIHNWGKQVEHRVAQAAGKARWYETFRLRICRVEHDDLLPPAP